MSEFEVICYDDFSTDNTKNTILALQKRFSNLKLIEGQQNHGVCVARNTCLEEATGSYIWFIDPDDLIYPNIVSKLLSVAVQTEADFIATDYTRVDSDFHISGLFEEDYSKAIKNYRTIEKDQNYLPKDQNGKQMCAVWAGIFRRSFLIDNSLQFRAGMIAQEDTLFYYEFEQRNPKIVKLDVASYYYRMRPNSVMHSKSEERSKAYYQSMCIMLDVYRSYYNKYDVCDANLKEKINHSQENIALCLALIKDTAFVKVEMRNLQNNGLYPFPTRWAALRGNSGIFYKVNSVLLPHTLYFWFLHYLNKYVDKYPFIKRLFK